MRKALAVSVILTLLVSASLVLGETPDKSEQPSVSALQGLVDKTIAVMKLQDELIAKQEKQINTLSITNILLTEKIRVLEIIIENLEKRLKLDGKVFQPKNNLI